MHVSIMKGPFEKYTIDGEEHEVIAALEQLGFQPERYIQAQVEEGDGNPADLAPEDNVKGVGPGEDVWESITYDQIKAGDIIRVTGEKENSLLPNTLTGRDSEQRPQRTRTARSEGLHGWKDAKNRTVDRKSVV